MFAEYARLRSMLIKMERDLGFEKLSSCELDILAAVERLTSDSITAFGSAIVREATLMDHSRATVYRSLAKLIEAEIIVVSGATGKPEYEINRRALR